MDRGRIISISLLLVVIFLSAGIRMLKIDADAPQVFPNKFQSSGPVKDEAAKSYEARNRTLFGTWSLSEKDNYRYWRTLSPVWVWSVWLWFEAFGASYVSLRIFSIVCSAISIILIYLVLRRSHGAGAGLAAAFLFAANFYLQIYGRLGLMETALNASIILTALIMIRSLDRPGLFLLAPIVFLAACLIKQSALFFAPVLVAGLIMAFLGRLSGSRRKAPWLWLGILSILIVSAFLLYLYSQPEYKMRTVMNVRHALDYGQFRYGMIIRLSATKKALLFAFSPSGILRGYLMMMPVAGTLAVLEIIAFIYLTFRSRAASGAFKLDRAEAIIVLWFIMARATLALTPHEYVRFYLIQFPPACLLAGIMLKRILEPESEKARERHSRLERLSMYAAILILALAFNMLPYARWLSTPSYQIRDGGNMLEAAIGERPAVIIGEWAGPLCLDTPYRSFYVKNIFNRRPDQVASFSVTHLIFADPEVDTAVISFRETFPTAFEKRKEIAVIELFGQTLHLCEVAVPGRGISP